VSCSYVVISSEFGEGCQGTPFVEDITQTDICFAKMIYQCNSSFVTMVQFTDTACTVENSTTTVPTGCRGGASFQCVNTIPVVPNSFISGIFTDSSCTGSPIHETTYESGKCFGILENYSKYQCNTNGSVTLFVKCNNSNCDGSCTETLLNYDLYGCVPIESGQYLGTSCTGAQKATSTTGSSSSSPPTTTGSHTSSSLPKTTGSTTSSDGSKRVFSFVLFALLFVDDVFAFAEFGEFEKRTTQPVKKE